MIHSKIFNRELDHAMLRRLEKRIIVDLPTQEARKKMFLHHLPPVVIEENGLLLASDLDYDRLASVNEFFFIIPITKYFIKEAIFSIEHRRLFWF